MKTEISRVLEDLSTPGQPRLGRGGWAVSAGRRTLAIIYDDPAITDKVQAQTASRAEAEAKAAELEGQAKVSGYFGHLSHEKRARLRREYNRIGADADYPTVAHYAYAKKGR